MDCLYAFGPTYKDLREYKKLQRYRKTKGDRAVYIPEEAFAVGEEYLPYLDEVRIQEQPQNFQDGSSVSYESEGIKFKYSMGGNIKLYDDHIALTSPRKKVKIGKYSYQILDNTMESSLNNSPARSVLSANFGTLDMTPKIFSSPVKSGLEVNAKNAQGRTETLDESKPENGKTNSDLQIQAVLERLRLADDETKQLSKSNPTSSSIADSIAKVDSWRTDFNNCNSPSHNAEEVNSGDTDFRQENTSSGNGARVRDYSPIRTTPAMENLSKLKDDKTPSIEARTESYPIRTSEEKIFGEPEVMEIDVSSRNETGNKNFDAKRGEMQDPERMNRYNRTLLYVSEQNETLHNGDYNELNVDLSDLSSDVFTDSEIPTSGFLSQSRDGKSDLDFYPDSPTTEQAFSKTPCSSRKNSLDSYISGDSMSATEMNQRTGIQKNLHQMVSNGEVHSNSYIKQNGRAKQQQGVRTKASDGKSHQLKCRQGAKTVESKKMDFNKKAKSKVNSFSNIGHVPGGGRVKIQQSKLGQSRRVEPRTDTHGVEAYSNLPSEFQEIAKRLAKQDRQLRNSKISGSSLNGRSRTRSRRSSRGSSRTGSVSPDRRSTSKPNFRLGTLTGSSFNLNTSTTSLGHSSPNKASRRPVVNRSPSIRSRPTTPSLSRSHPATYVTPYDSRSRPSSRPSSRPNSRPTSPVSLSRNASPTNGGRSRGSSPVPTSRKSSTLSRTSPNANRSKKKMANGMGGRSMNFNALTSVEIGLASGSVFQVIPVHK
ncbi:Microtubule-associated protein 2 [Stylophora pistillata]|uniref:Microtubule-associated protein 2 n=1 Tax=Stylophora pistillata TaxID=50429 RepID=A0A2B4RJM2_STYPI|nr:Microtubule-associated protein 2 [Stylophora pistillata]